MMISLKKIPANRKPANKAKRFQRAATTEQRHQPIAGGKFDVLPKKKEGLPEAAKTATQKRKARRKRALSRIATATGVVTTPRYHILDPANGHENDTRVCSEYTCGFMRTAVNVTSLKSKRAVHPHRRSRPHPFP